MVVILESNFNNLCKFSGQLKRLMIILPQKYFEQHGRIKKKKEQESSLHQQIELQLKKC
jgi:hypothetical protein